jgi:phage FluMu protein Com
MSGWWNVRCPQCRSVDQHHVLLTPRNFAVIAINVLLLASSVLTGILVREGFSLRRKCLKCGTVSIGPWREPPNFDACAGCGYNLTCNVSGRCPECGWKLPRRFRAWRRKMDRLQQGQKTTEPGNHEHIADA